MMFLSF